MGKQRTPRTPSHIFKTILSLCSAFLLLIGPGLLVMIGDNDAGGVLTYAQTGASYGLLLFLPLILVLIPVAYVVQEMTVRLGAVTQQGHGELIFKRFGRFWGYFSLFDLAMGNILTVVTEFIGMGVALMIFGVPLYVTIPSCIVMISLLVLCYNYITTERIILGVAVFNLIFIPVAFMTHPSVASLEATLSIHVHTNFAALLFLIIANIGTTIAPWMIFYQQSAVVDKGLKPEDIKDGRLDTLIGSLGMGLVAIAIITITTLTLFSHHVNASNFQIQDYITALGYYVGRTGVTLFAIGLFEAGLVASIIISLSSAWAFGEVFNWKHTLNAKPNEAWQFYVVFIITITSAGIIVMIPHIPLVAISQTAQVIATILMPPALTLLLLLLNDHTLMGEYVNTKKWNVITWVIVAVILILSTTLGLITIFPNLMG